MCYYKKIPNAFLNVREIFLSSFDALLEQILHLFKE
jgi:hypothetical protein